MDLFLDLFSINDMPQGNLFLYVDDACLVSQHKNVNKIKKIYILRMSGCFITNQLNMHLGDEKTKSTFQP